MEAIHLGCMYNNFLSGFPTAHWVGGIYLGLMWKEEHGSFGAHSTITA